MSRRDFLVLSALCLLCAALNLPQLDNAFVHDDVSVLAGGLIEKPGRMLEVFGSHAMLAQGQTEPLAMDTYRPISILTFFWDAWLSGQKPWSYHLTNLLLHLGCVVCLFLLTRRVFPRAPSPLVAACVAFFALSPQLVEAHVWINGRSDPLATLFGLWALLVYGPAVRDHSTVRFGGAFVLFLLGLLSKEVLLCTLPLILLWPASSPVTIKARLRGALPMLLAALVYVPMRLQALGGVRASRDSEQVLLALHNLPILLIDGLSELLWPRRLYLHNMREEYASYGGSVFAACLAGCVLLGVVLLIGRRRLPFFAWSLAWYGLCLAPAALISALLWPGFGRYLYLPCAGLTLGLCELLSRADGRVAPALRIAFGVLVSAYLIFFCVRFSAYARDYRDEDALYGAAMRKAPGRAVGYAWLGATRVREGKVDEGLLLFEQAMRLEPAEPSYALRAVFWNLRLARPAQAERLARYAIAHGEARHAGEFRALLVRALMDRDAQAAIVELCQCLTIDPSQVRCLEAPRWLLDPRAKLAPELRKALAGFDRSCASPVARGALAAALRDIQASP